MILSICDSATVLEVLYYVKIVIKLICIAVPIILIVTMLIDTVKTVSSGDANLSDLFKKYSIKLIAAILVFFIPTFVNIIADVVGNDEYNSCLKFATREEIENAKYKEIDKLIEVVFKSYKRSDLNIAKSKINQLGDESKKQSYLNKLTEIEKTIKKIEEIKALTSATITKEKYDEAEKFVSSLPEGDVKKSLQKKLEELKKSLTPQLTHGTGG